jgi:hypothetical protein
MSIAYPKEVPFADVSNVIAMLTGTKPADKAVIAKSGWVTVGYVIGLTVGEPASGASLYALTDLGVTNDSPSRVNSVSDNEVAAVLSALLALESPSVSAEFKAAGLLDIVGSDFIRKELARLILPFLLNKLKEWVAGGGLEELLGRFVGTTEGLKSIGLNYEDQVALLEAEAKACSTKCCKEKE